MVPRAASEQRHPSSSDVGVTAEPGAGVPAPLFTGGAHYLTGEPMVDRTEAGRSSFSWVTVSDIEY